jgi:hypothetical protein
MLINKYKSHLISKLEGRIGIYGYAKSYGGKGVNQNNKIPPYFFRGELNNLKNAYDDLIYEKHNSFLSEEMEMVYVLDIRQKDKVKFIGFTFGNDLTDLSEFREDPSRLLHAKSPKASIADIWFECEKAPLSLDINVRRTSCNSVVEEYSAQLGSDCLNVHYEDSINAVSKMIGVENYTTILLFTGAPRGFAWKDKPINNLDIIELNVNSIDSILKNKVLYKL